MQDTHDQTSAFLGSTSCTRRVFQALAALGSVGLVASCGASMPPAEAPAAAAEQPSDELTYSSEAAGESEGTVSDESPEQQSIEAEAEAAPAVPDDLDMESGESLPPERKKRNKGWRANVEKSIEAYDLPKSLSAIDVYDRRLSATIELKAPDCEQAENFRRAVCQLAERICVLEQDLPTTVERHCADSRTRCVSAAKRYSATCEA